MNDAELIGRLTGVIGELSGIIDELYALLSQHISAEEAERIARRLKTVAQAAGEER